MVFRRFLFVSMSAFLFRAAFLMLVGPTPQMYMTPDSSGYIYMGNNLAKHHTFSGSQAPPLKPETIRTPGYPAFLSLFAADETHRILLIAWIQAILGALTAGLLFLTANVLWRKGLASMTTGLAMALDYVIILYSSFIMTEALFLLFFVLSLFCFARFLAAPASSWKPLLLSGFLSGLATLVRPVSLYYFVVPGFVLIYRGWTKKLPHAAGAFALFMIVSAALPFLWMARNRVVVGEWTISTIQGLTRASILEERLSNTTYEKASAILDGRFKQEHPKGFPNPGVEAATKSIWSTKYILKHPKDYCFVIAQESIRLMAGNGMKASAWLIFKDPRHDPFRIPVHAAGTHQDQARELSTNHPLLGVTLALYLGWLALIYLSALAGLITIWKTEKHIVIWFVLTTAYFFLVSVGFGTGARYRIPLMPGLFLLAGLGFERLLMLLVNPNGKIGVGKVIG